MNFETKIEKSKDVIKEAVENFGENNIAVAWTSGKDSTVALHIVREMFNGAVPLRTVFVDTTVQFPETYSFMKRLEDGWNLNLIRATNTDALETIEIAKDRERCCHLLKTVALEQVINEHAISALITGIRRDEQGARGNEVYFSPRETHTRVHPILDWSEDDIWKYIRDNSVPYNPLYDTGYRSIGCKPCTKPAKEGGSERSGRSQDKEEIMERLRSLGYF